MLKHLILRGAYYLQGSRSYQAKKLFIYNILEDNTNKFKKNIDIFMIILIFISVGVLIREVKHPVNDTLLFFSTYIISIIFFIEYILRLWVSSSVSQMLVAQSEHDTFLSKKVNLSKAFKKVLRVKFRYVITLRAIIDLLAILPFFHELRLLRTFILFRIFKLFRYVKSFETLSGILATKKFEFIALFVFASIIIFISSVLMYVMEANNPASPVNTLFDALYWSVVTISTVGYGDVTPITDAGRVVAMVVIVSGIAVLAFTTSLIVSAFTERLDEVKEMRQIENIMKLKDYYLICGYESVAKELAQKLLKSKRKIVVLDNTVSRVEMARNDGLLALCYETGSIESYKKLNIDLKNKVRSVLCLYEDDIENVYTALTIRSLDKNIFILSLLMQDTNRKKLEFIGISHILYPQEIVGLKARELTRKAAAFEVIHELRSEYTNVDIDEIMLTSHIVENFPTIGSLANKKFRMIILGLFKGESDRFYFNPLDDVFLENGDYLLVVGYSDIIAEFKKSLQMGANYE